MTDDHSIPGQFTLFADHGETTPVRAPQEAEASGGAPAEEEAEATPATDAGSVAATPCADVMAEPEVEAFPPALGRSAQRLITYSWVIKEDENDGTVLFQVMCSHGRGQYVANLRNATRSGPSTRYSIMDFHQLLSEPTNRYNKKEFEAFAQRALAKVREQRADEKVQEFRHGEHA